MAACQRCGTDLGVLRSLAGDVLCGGCGNARRNALASFEHAVSQALADRVLAPEEEDRLRRYQYELGISDAEVSGLLPALWRGKLLHTILSDGLPPVEAAPILLKRGETAYWTEGATLLEERTKTVTVGRSSGYSIRIMKGVSYRVGSSRGQRVPVSEIHTVGPGHLVVTNKRVVFVGARQISVTFAKLLTVSAYEDGIELHYEGQKKRQLFVVADGEVTGAAVLVTSQRE